MDGLESAVWTDKMSPGINLILVCDVLILRLYEIVLRNRFFMNTCDDNILDVLNETESRKLLAVFSFSPAVVTHLLACRIYNLSAT